MNSSKSGSDVIVVGSGIIGIACAHYLRQTGRSVTVLEKGKIAAGCSYGNCGYISPSHVLPLTEPGALKEGLKSLFNPDAPFRIRPSFDPPLWKWLFQFARRCTHAQMLSAGVHLKAILNSSMAEYQHLIEHAKLDCEWKHTGLLYVLQSEKGMQKFAEHVDFMTEHFDVGATRIEGESLPQFDSSLKSGLAGGFHYAMDASVRPDRLNSTWVNFLKEQGVQFVENCNIQGITREQGKITQITTSAGKMPVAEIVFAAGAMSSKLATMLNCRIPVQPGKGYSVTMSKPNPAPSVPMLFPEHRVGVSPFDNGYRLGSMMEFCGFDDSIPDRRIQQLRRSAEPYLHTPYTTGESQAWCGWRPMTWDSLPIIGAVPKLQNSYLATGHNMLGMSLATATGKLIREIMDRTTTHIDAKPFSPSRF
ncbi:NAD(P)/FAD-dependent oxidoreductase [Planctomicrobium sp. SH668]|uniref:NAD(P)/FAD-dependent oxidoreductase n=1 Tax=Planctomicrobium sp. SH668 TaxID=3448126 RepID=UPI003F5BA84E